MLRSAGVAGAGGGGPLLYVADLRSSDVRAIDPRTGAMRLRVPVAADPHELVCAGGRVWVSDFRSGRVTVLAGGRDDGRTVAIAGEPHGLAVSDGRVAVTEGSLGRVGIVDVSTESVVAEAEVGGLAHMVVAAGERFYVVDAESDAVVEVDPRSGGVLRRVATGRTPEAIAVSPDERTLAVADARSGDLTLIDRRSFTAVRVPLPGAPVRVAYAPDGKMLAVSLSDAGAVALLDTEGRVKAVVPAGRLPDGLAFDFGGRLLYVALSGDHRVAVVHPRDRRLVRYLETGEGPSGLLLAGGTVACN